MAAKALANPIDIYQWIPRGPQYLVAMAHAIRNQCEPNCPVCGIPMVLVRVEPRVASFSELRTFRCFACDDGRVAEQKTLLFRHIAAGNRPRLNRAA